MHRAELEDAQVWAERQWGAAALGDQRRTKRAVQLGAAIAAQPAASVPQQTGSWAATKAAYRLLNEQDVTHAALIAPHCQATRAAAATARDVVLFIQDTSDGDYTHHPQTRGLGLLGKGDGRGFMMHNCLAVVPGTPPQLIGLAAQQVWLREAVKHGTETRTARQKRWRESEVWAETVEAIGSVPEGAGAPLWVSVGDRAADNFAYWRRSRARGWHLVTRVVQERRIETATGGADTLLRYGRSLAGQTTKRISLRGRTGAARREVELQISYARIRVLAPRRGAESKAGEQECWLVRCWEAAADERGAGERAAAEQPQRIEWVLVTSIEVAEAATAQQVVEWYATRWVVEEYHKCLKSGCRMEARQLASGRGLINLLGFLAVVAVRLLQLREESRRDAKQLAVRQVTAEMVGVVVSRVGMKVAAEEVTLKEFWHGVARLGGFIGRTSDGEPGWQTLWRGWQRLQDMCWGVAHANSS